MRITHDLLDAPYRPDVIAPTVHLNGSGADNLTNDRLAVLDALADAMTALRAMAPNGRDYYTATNPNEAWKQALAQHADREKQLNYLIDSITSEIEAIQA